MAFLWVVTLLGAVAGGLVFMFTLVSAKSSPQEAAGFAMAMACVVIPYVFTRACEGIGNWQRRLIDAVEEVGRKVQASVADRFATADPGGGALTTATGANGLAATSSAGADTARHKGGHLTFQNDPGVS